MNGEKAPAGAAAGAGAVGGRWACALRRAARRHARMRARRLERLWIRRAFRRQRASLRLLDAALLGCAGAGVAAVVVPFAVQFVKNPLTRASSPPTSRRTRGLKSHTAMGPAPPLAGVSLPRIAMPMPDGLLAKTQPPNVSGPVFQTKPLSDVDVWWMSGR